MFTVITLGISAVSGINEVLDALEIPDLSDLVKLGPFSFVTDALDAVIDLFQNAIRGIIYVILVIFFDHFLTAVKSQFVGSFTSIFFLVRAYINVITCSTELIILFVSCIKCCNNDYCVCSVCQ